jgi:hypothetical protein
MRNRSTAAVAALLLLAFLAACGEASSSGEPSSTPQSASPSIEATAEPTPETTDGLPSPGSVADLEALIPDEIGGIALQKFSMRGNEFVSSGSATQETQDFLEGLGVSTDDVAVAFGFGVSPASGEGVAVFVFRADGAGSDRLVSVFKEATDAERDAPLDWESANVGGKEVQRALDPEQNDQVVYLYAKGDTLFFLAATQEEHAEEALAALP